MQKHAALVGDYATAIVYALLLYHDRFVWAATGVHLAIRYATGTLHSSCVSVSVLQLSNTCERLRAVVPPAAGYGIAGLGIALCLAARTDIFHDMSPRARGAVVIMFYTLALTMNRVHSVAMQADIARVVLFVSISHYLRRHGGLADWESEARACWVLACYAMPALAIALLQLAVDTADDGKALLPTTHAKEPFAIETWDLVRPVPTSHRKPRHT